MGSCSVGSEEEQSKGPGLKGAEARINSLSGCTEELQITLLVSSYFNSVQKHLSKCLGIYCLCCMPL